MDQATHNKIVSFIWGIADDVLRALFVRGKYRDVILPMCVLRRLDAVLEPGGRKGTRLDITITKNVISSRVLFSVPSFPSFSGLGTRPFSRPLFRPPFSGLGTRPFCGLIYSTERFGRRKSFLSGVVAG
jgi:hypothetical protein